MSVSSFHCMIIIKSAADKILYYNIQRDAKMSSQYFILLQYHSICFGCPLQPSSGVQETAVAATGIRSYTPVSWEA
jgi:hypothetical protein